MPSEGNKSPGLQPVQIQAAELLAEGCTIRDTALALEVGESTIYTWKANIPEFWAQVKAIRNAAHESSVGLLTDHCRKSVSVLAELLDSKKEMIRLTAARLILSSTVELRQSVELAQELDDLKRLAEKAGLLVTS